MLVPFWVVWASYIWNAETVVPRCVTFHVCPDATTFVQYPEPALLFAPA